MDYDYTRLHIRTGKQAGTAADAYGISPAARQRCLDANITYSPLLTLPALRNLNKSAKPDAVPRILHQIPLLGTGSGGRTEQRNNC